MLRISLAEDGGGSDCLRLEGRAVGLWLAEIRTQCEARLARGAMVCLDLSEVTYIDREGVILFLDLKSRGVTMHGCSPFLEEELKMGENSEQGSSGR